MHFLDSITLSSVDERRIRSYYSQTKWAEEALKAARAAIYIKEVLEDVESNSARVGRCCSDGSITFRRKDGALLTDNDVEAILLIPRGQVNKVQKRTADEVTIYWLCDSGD